MPILPDVKRTFRGGRPFGAWAGTRLFRRFVIIPEVAHAQLSARGASISAGYRWLFVTYRPVIWREAVGMYKTRLSIGIPWVSGVSFYRIDRRPFQMKLYKQIGKVGSSTLRLSRSGVALQTWPVPGRVKFTVGPLGGRLTIRTPIKGLYRTFRLWAPAGRERKLRIKGAEEAKRDLGLRAARVSMSAPARILAALVYRLRKYPPDLNKRFLPKDLVMYTYMQERIMSMSKYARSKRILEKTLYYQNIVMKRYWYERGVGLWVARRRKMPRFDTKRKLPMHRTYFYLKYRSEDFKNAWSIEMYEGGAVARNQAFYAAFLISDRLQAWFHKRHGWKTISQRVEEIKKYKTLRNILQQDWVLNVKEAPLSWIRGVQIARTLPRPRRIRP